MTLKHIAASAALILLSFASCGPSKEPAPARSSATDKGTHQGPSDEQDHGPAPAITPPRGEADKGADGLTILLDDPECADPEFEAGGDQPSAIARLTEPDGSTGVLIMDFGISPDALRHNLRLWLHGNGLTDLPGTPEVRRAFYCSHWHTFEALTTPIYRPRWTTPWLAIKAIDELLGEVPVRGPNFNEICDVDLMKNHVPTYRESCQGRFLETEGGLSPVIYSDGTASKRAWTLTYAFVEPEDDAAPFQGAESVFIFRDSEGYVVYSACSHVAQVEPPDQPPFHAVELVKARIDRGELPPARIHTLITGGCGMHHFLETRAGDRPLHVEEIPEIMEAELTALAQRTGLRRVYLSHCARYFQKFNAPFLAVFGDQAQRATPGSWIPLPSPR